MSANLISEINYPLDTSSLTAALHSQREALKRPNSQCACASKRSVGVHDYAVSN